MNPDRSGPDISLLSLLIICASAKDLTGNSPASGNLALCPLMKSFV
jgi:hypothetical protein